MVSNASLIATSNSSMSARNSSWLAVISSAHSGTAATIVSRTMSAYTFTSVGSAQRCGLGLPPSSGKEKSYLYCSGVIVRSPSSMICTPSATFACASALVGSSSCSPLMNTTSAMVITSAADGGGSKVCELVPSGTMPMISAQSPMTLAAIEVIGATVVTTWKSEAEPVALPSASAVSESSLPHAASRSVKPAAPASARRSEWVDDMISDCTCDLFASTVGLEIVAELGLSSSAGIDS